MNGSEKQVTWATSIRSAFIREVEAWHRSNAAPAAKAGQTAQWDAAIAEVIRLANAQNDAAWWIDHRSETDVLGRGAVIREFYAAAVVTVTEGK